MAGGVCSYHWALNCQLCNSDFSAPSERRGLKNAPISFTFHVFVRLSPCNTRIGEWIWMKLNIWYLYQKIVAILYFSIVEVMDVLRECIKLFLR